MLINYLLAHTWAVLAALASVLLTLHVLGTRRSPQSVLAWLLALIFVPPLGIPLYLMFGTRKLTRHTRALSAPRVEGESDEVARLTPGAAGIQRVLASAGASPPRMASSFELISDGVLAYEALMGLIDNAQRTIHLSYFILGNDATGDAIVTALAARARSGVEVRVILDAVGSRPMLGHTHAELKAAGGQVRVFNKLIHRPLRSRSNLRSHRKLAIADGNLLFTGGMNLALEYMGRLPRPERWVDLASLTRGAVVQDAEALFAADWAQCGGSASDLTLIAAKPEGEAIMQVVASGPDLADDALYDALITAIAAGSERIAVVTPYYVPDDALQRALLLSARRGVRTQLVLPVRSNHALADFARHTSVRELRTAGVEIYGYPLGMVHAKAMIVDSRFAYIGSPNFDVRSLLLNYENALFLYSAKEVSAIGAWIDDLRAKCTTDGFDRRRREWWLFEQVARLLAPEL